MSTQQSQSRSLRAATLTGLAGLHVFVHCSVSSGGGDHDMVLFAVRQTLSCDSKTSIDRCRTVEGRAREMPQAVCPRCGTGFIAQLWLGDLKTVVNKLGFDYTLKDGHVLQDFCPRCKRIIRGLSYASLNQSKEKVFSGSRIKEDLTQ